MLLNFNFFSDNESYLIKNFPLTLSSNEVIKRSRSYIKHSKECLKLRSHTAINRADFVSWCMLYTYEGNKIIREKMTLYFHR